MLFCFKDLVDILSECCERFYRSKLLLLMWRDIFTGTEYEYKPKEGKEML